MRTVVPKLKKNQKGEIDMKKLNKKALFGIGAGLVAATVGACCLFKKKGDDEDYVEGEAYEDEYTEVENDVVSEEN